MPSENQSCPLTSSGLSGPRGQGRAGGGGGRRVCSLLPRLKRSCLGPAPGSKDLRNLRCFPHVPLKPYARGRGRGGSATGGGAEEAGAPLGGHGIQAAPRIQALGGGDWTRNATAPISLQLPQGPGSWREACGV